MNQVLDLPIEQVFRNEDQPRQNFPQEHIDGLARSIAENGLLQPITVRKVVRDSDGKHYLMENGLWLHLSSLQSKWWPTLQASLTGKEAVDGVGTGSTSRSPNPSVTTASTSCVGFETTGEASGTSFAAGLDTAASIGTTGTGRSGACSKSSTSSASSSRTFAENAQKPRPSSQRLAGGSHPASEPTGDQTRRLSSRSTEDAGQPGSAESLAAVSGLPVSSCVAFLNGKRAVFEIVAGECRTRAVRQLGLPTIRAIVATEMADSERDIMAIIENLQRRDINVMEEARAYQRMLSLGWSVEDLSKRLGLRQPHRIRDRVLLLQMRPEYQGLTEQGHLTPYQAWFLAQLDPQRQDRLFKAIKDGKVTDVEKLKVFGEALLTEQSQGSMFGDAETGKLSDEEQEKVTRLEKKVEAMAAMVAAGFDKDNGVDIARKVAPHRAVEMAEKLELIAKHIAMLTKELRKSAAQLELAA